MSRSKCIVGFTLSPQIINQWCTIDNFVLFVWAFFNYKQQVLYAMHKSRFKANFSMQTLFHNKQKLLHLELLYKTWICFQFPLLIKRMKFSICENVSTIASSLINHTFSGLIGVGSSSTMGSLFKYCQLVGSPFHVWQTSECSLAVDTTVDMLFFNMLKQNVLSSGN